MVRNLNLKRVTMVGIAAFQMFNPQMEMRAQAQTTQRESVPACVVIQGNGQNFASHMGTVIALLEKNIEPKVAIGGSSGANIAAIVRSLLENPSLQTSSVVNAQGLELTLPEKAALVLASSRSVIEGFLLLPMLSKIGAGVLSAASGVLGVGLSGAFYGFPGTQVVGQEAILGQTVMTIDFLNKADFSQLLQEKDLRRRTLVLSELWQNHADPLWVTPDEFIVALFTPPGTSSSHPRAMEIRRRYFELFREDTTKPEHDPKVALRHFNHFLEKNAKFISSIPKHFLTQQFEKLLAILQNIPVAGQIFPLPGKSFALPNPERTWSAHLGIDLAGRVIQMPKSSVLHTTARLSERSLFGTRIEKTGEEYFYQVYFSSEDLQQELTIKNDRFPAHQSLMNYVKPDGTLDSVLPKNQVLLLNQRNLAQALKPSLSEPVFFRRDELPLSAQERNHAGIADPKLEFTGYGGWFDMIPSSLAAQLDACRQASLHVQIGLKSVVDPFQVSSLRPVFEGPRHFLRKATDSDLANPQNTSPFAKMYRRIAEYRAYSFAGAGLQNPLLIEHNWNRPSDLPGKEGEQLGRSISRNRLAMLLGGYQAGAKRLNGVNNIVPESAEVHAFGELSENAITQMSSLHEVEAFVNQVFGDPL